MANEAAHEDDFLDECQRRDEALQKSFKYLEDNLENTESAKNNVRASNSVAWELGAFKRGRNLDAPISKEALEGLIIRTRNDALESKMNSADILDRILNLEKKIHRIELITGCGIGMAIALLLRISF